ncbi:MAG: lanthionine synthetase LanC family protein, partial [Dehalococcoidia bacterium]
ELAQATGVEKYLEIAKAAAQLLLSQAVAGTEGGWRWARDLNQPMLATQQWCHGVLGIGRFFLRLARQGPDPRYLEAARRAAQTVIGEIDEVEYSGLCHGVAGSGSFLLDCYQYFAEPRYLKEAQRCGERLQRFRVPDSTGVYAMTANGSISPHLFRGYAGVGMFALRLAHPETLADPILG